MKGVCNSTMWPICQIIIPCISFIFIKIKFIHFHYCVMFLVNSMSICNDEVDHDEIIIQ